MVKKNNLTRKDWLVYLNNLNNREISKQNSSGFTTWALLGFIGFILFKLLNSLPIIIMDVKNVFLFQLFITNIFNIFVVIIIFLPVLIIPLSGRRKIHTKLLKKIAILVTGIIYFICVIGFFCNIYIAIKLKIYGLSILPYCVFAIFEIFFIIGYAIIKITAKKEDKMPRVDSGYLYNSKHKNSLKKIYIVLSIGLLSFFLFSIYQIIQNDYFFNYISVLESAIYLGTFIGVIIVLIGKSVIQAKNRWVEEFERKIMLQNLDEKEIVKAFIDEFVGKDILRWLSEIKDETEEEKIRVIKFFDKLEKEVNSLNPKEKDLNKRIIKEENILKKFKELDNCLDEHIEKFSNNTDKVNHFLQQGPLSDEEELLIREFKRTRNKDNKFLKELISKKGTLIERLDKYNNVTKRLVKSKEK